DTSLAPDVRNCYPYDVGDGGMGAERTWPAGAGRAGAVHRARVRADHGGGDRQAGRAHRADVLPALRRQARGSVRRRGALQELLAQTVAYAPDSTAPIDWGAAARHAAAPGSRSAASTPGSARPSSPRTQSFRNAS